MLRSAELLVRKDATTGYGANSAPWRSLPESQMRAVLVVVANLPRERSLQTAFVDCNDVVQEVTTATLDPRLRDAVLPRSFERCSDDGDYQRSHGWPKSNTVPADHRFRSYDDERLLPPGPNSASYHPEEFVQ